MLALVEAHARRSRDGSTDTEESRAIRLCLRKRLYSHAARLIEDGHSEPVVLNVLSSALSFLGKLSGGFLATRPRNVAVALLLTASGYHSDDTAIHRAVLNLAYCHSAVVHVQASLLQDLGCA